jgi:hypothetical protein
LSFQDFDLHDHSSETLNHLSDLTVGKVWHWLSNLEHPQQKVSTMTSQSVNSADASDTQLIVFPPDRGIGVLAVVPPYPVGFKPQTDGALGININLVHGDRDGLLVYILAYTDMSVGDTISVYIESKNAPVAKFSVNDAHFDAQGIAKNIPFYISAKIMESRFAPLQKQNKDFWFEVQRISGNSEGSPPVPLFYKYPAPGEADTDGGKPFNQGLKLPVASESVVDKTVIDEGMFVTVLEYFNQHIGDVVVLACGSLLLETTVTEMGDVLFELLPEQLATLAPTNSLVVRWEVYDVVENASGWSDSLLLTFKPGVVLLSAPIFEQADADNVLNHDGLVGGAANVLVTGVFSSGDVIDLTLQGVTKGGEPVTHVYSQPLAGSSRAVDFSFENERVRNLIGGTVRASYTLTKAGKVQQSKPADAMIAGTSQPLGAPIVTPLVDGKLPVDTTTATVQVADYWPLKSRAKVELRWQTTDQDGITTLFIFALIVTDPAQPVIFKVPARYIAPYAGAPLTVQNTITNPGQVEVFSELAQLMFGEDMKITLLPPTVIGQSGNNFSPTLPEIRVLVPQGPLLPTDKLSVTWAGAIAVPAASYTSPQRLVSAGLEIAVPRSVLAYSLGKTVTVTYTVERNGVSTTSPPLTLNILPLPTTALNPPKIVEADANNFLDIVALGSKDAIIHALLHSLIEKDQQCWLSLEGEKADGTAHNRPLWTGYPARVNDTWIRQGFWPHGVPNSYLKDLGHGSKLTIKYKVALNKSNGEAEATVFPDRVYTIKAVELVRPTLTHVLDDKGVEVLEAGFTVSTSLTLKGAASKGLQVEIFDGSGASAVSRGKATADQETGLWSLAITVPLGGRRLYAQSLYHSTPEYSNVRTLTVTAATAPTITTVKGSPSGADIPNNGTTVDMTVILTGTAANGQKVEVRDNAVPQGQPTAIGTTGKWELTVDSLAAGAHSFTVLPLYGAGQESAPWKFVVRDVEDFEGIPDVIVSEVGQSATTKKFRITLLSKTHSPSNVSAARHWENGPVKGNVLYGYVSNYITGSISYRLDLLGRTADRITLWAAGGNIPDNNGYLTLTFRNPAGATLLTINRHFTNGGNLQQIDSGKLLNIAAIVITANQGIMFDNFEFL